MRLFFIIFFSALIAITPSAAFAQSDEFTVTFQISGDTTPPSAPSSLVAAPIATTQINLSWDASIDDVAIGGYQVFRDAVQIATTSLLTYADTGLAASTTYTYFITAFDTSFNYSSSSGNVATTTLPLAPSTQPPSGGGSSIGDVELVSFAIEPDIYAASVSWETNRYAQFQLRWGRSTSYELGFVSNEVFKHEHTTLISELEPGTTYEYQLIGFNRDGIRFVLSEGQFQTLSIPDSFPPSNVSNLAAVKQGKGDVLLTWNNPDDSDFSHVRIVRSHLFYPSDPYDGFIAYQGKNKSFLDTQALQNQEYQYYTVFSYDDKGNVSSGAIVAIARDELPSQESQPGSTLSLSFDDIEVLQKNKLIFNQELDGNLPTTFRIPYEKLPEHLKSIVITLTHPDDPSRSFSFLLRINNDKTYYEATVAPLRTEGAYQVSVIIFDYQTRELLRIEGAYAVRIHTIGDIPVFFFPILESYPLEYTYLFCGLLLFILLGLLYFFIRKYTRKE